jgi:lipopolysaccharide exporter
MSQHDPSIAKRTARGAGWLIASRLAARGIDFLTLMGLARLLVPHDFGLVAMGMTLVQMVEAVFDLPVTQVLVRARDVDQELVDTCFTISLLRGLLLAVCLCALAWPAAVFWHDGRMAPLICFLALAPMLRALQSPAMAHYARALHFRPDLAVEVGGKLGAFALAIGVGVMTRSYWAIAAGTVAGPLLMVILSYALAPMRPRLCLRQWSHFRTMIGWTSGAQLLSAINWQFDRLLLARFVPAASLGQFTMASDLSGLPFQALVLPMFRPLTSAYAQIQHQGGDLGAKFLQSCQWILALTLPVSVGLAMLAEPALRFALGEKWVGAAVWLQGLALIVPLSLFTVPFGAVAMAQGRNHLSWHFSLAEMVVKLPLMLVMIEHFGVLGAVIGRGVTGLVMFGVYLLVIGRILKLGVGAVLAALGPVVLAVLGMGMVLAPMARWCVGLSGWSLGLGLVGLGLVGLMVYAALLLLLGFAPARVAAGRVFMRMRVS